MKRSTIILIIYFVLNLITPIIILKSCTSGTPQERVDKWETAIGNSKASVRYLLVNEGENDSTQLDIHIRMVKEAGNPGRTLINGEEYDKDTLLIASDSQGEINLIYEEKIALIIGNRNPHATFHIEEAIIDELMISSRGDVNIDESNIGVLVVTDSLGVGQVAIEACNVGTLASSREGEQRLYIESSNVGHITIPMGSTLYEIENCNVGVMVNGGKRELVVGGSHMNMKIAIDVDSLEEVAEKNDL